MRNRIIFILCLLLLFSASLACQIGPEASYVESTSDELTTANTQDDIADQSASQPMLISTPQESPDNENEGVINTESPQINPAQAEFVIDPNAGSFEGYTLFSPINSKTTYLIDNNGQLINSWDSNYTPGQSVYLLKDGSLLRTANNSPGPNGSALNAGGAGGRIEIYNWEGDLTWFYELNNEQYRLHHDIDILPNGHILAVAWEQKTTTETISAGRNPNLLSEGVLWPDMIFEIEPTGSSGGNIVWEWHVWDHLVQDYDPSQNNYGVIADHPEWIDLNFVRGRSNADWNHINSIDYNPGLDQIVISAHSFSEIWVIDHSTTTTESATHSGGNSGMGGDILYRWGNPQVYDRGSSADQTLFMQHDAEWIDNGLPGEGNILIFNNGQSRPDGDYSSIDEIIPPLNAYGTYDITPNQSYAPESAVWTYTTENPTDFYGKNISGSQRLPNGNTLICEGPTGLFFEVNLNGAIVWSFTNPIINLPRGGQGQGQDQPPSGTPSPGQQESGPNHGNFVFKIERYAPDYPGLADRDLTPKELLE
jgi:hypothetical protein